MINKKLLAVSLLSVAALVGCGGNTSSTGSEAPSSEVSQDSTSTTPSSETPSVSEIPQGIALLGGNVTFAGHDNTLKALTDEIVFPAAVVGENAAIEIAPETVALLHAALPSNDEVINLQNYQYVGQHYNSLTEEDPYVYTRVTAASQRTTNNVVVEESTSIDSTIYFDENDEIVRSGDITTKTQSVLAGVSIDGENSLLKLNKLPEDPDQGIWGTQYLYSDDSLKENMILGVGSMFDEYLEIVQSWSDYLSESYPEQTVVDDGVKGLAVTRPDGSNFVQLSFGFTKEETEGQMVADLEFDFSTIAVIENGIVAAVQLWDDIIRYYEDEPGVPYIYETDRETIRAGVTTTQSTFNVANFKEGGAWDLDLAFFA